MGGFWRGKLSGTLSTKRKLTGAAKIPGNTKSTGNSGNADTILSTVTDEALTRQDSKAT